ncbi:ABC transporter ATP-binding protein [Paenibacillus sp. JX-17]|uniref:ABC transporter ATP-binding protein n=1 Tax=Paenibacillus lacisoli TaxID=3064525 RepID=A0ABT9CBZ5_9BACL|nr:ABC transporter ATP-binding protein [Paenibacillus sp. JX-17]MDO7906785.1 ABC transporter ATP-binding protein [Paenibacillus sp. JX-17]
MPTDQLQHSSQSGGTSAPGPSAPSALEVDRVHLSFRENKQILPVLNDISLTVRQGEFVSIIGPSGSGKSTLFNLIGGMLKPDQGRITIQGKEAGGQRGVISYMPQQPALLPWRTTLDNVLLGLEVAPDAQRGGRDLAQAREEARAWLAQAGLAEFEQAYPHKLSGGMQQRAAFLRALLSPQELMLLDEPFSALDALTRSDMQRWLLDIWERSRRSVLFITHNIEEALLLSDTIYVFSSRPSTVLHRVEVPFPRPRTDAMADDPAFLEWKRTLSGWLREEQAKQG